MQNLNLSRALVIALLVGGMSTAAHAQARPTSFSPHAPDNTAAPEDYLIGPEDVLAVVVWREQEMSGDVAVRPDGMITLPLVGDVRAAGLTPAALKAQIEKEAGRLLTEPNVTVSVRQMNSRKVYITGEVSNPGAYTLTGPRTILQLIAMAGGLTEYADGNNITTLRNLSGRQVSYKFRYKDVSKGKALEQNIELQAGDTVVVP